MAHFLGQVEGQRGPASRLGNAKTGLRTVAAGWQGAISVRLWHEDGVDRYAVYLTPWQGSSGSSRLLSEGILDSNPS